MSSPDAASPARTIVAQMLTPAAFAPFGDVIVPVRDGIGGANSSPINEGTAQRFDDLTQLDVSEQGGEACVAIFRTQDGTHVAPYALTMFERHLLGSQSFVPMAQGRILVVVTQGGDVPDEDAIQAFIVEPGQGVTLRRGVWHHPMITIGGADVFVIERRAVEVDCEIARIRGRFIVVLREPAG